MRNNKINENINVHAIIHNSNLNGIHLFFLTKRLLLFHTKKHNKYSCCELVNMLGFISKRETKEKGTKKK